MEKKNMRGKVNREEEKRPDVKWGLSNSGIQWENEAGWDEDNITDQGMN